MFGKRFSVSASALAVAGACSVMLSSPVVVAQGYYQQTGFPRYGRPQVSGLSASSTQPPAFSDTLNDASAMSPNSWGESAIRNPNAGYDNTTTSVAATTAPAPSYVQPQSPSISVLTPTPAEPAEDALTNTQYSRSALRPDRYADASFAIDKGIQIANPPRLPEIEFPGQKKVSGNMGKMTFDTLTESTSPDKKNSASFEGVITPEISGADLSTRQRQIAQPPRAASQLDEAHYGYPLFSPSQNQPVYVLDTPQTAPSFFVQPDSLIRNETGGSYPLFEQTQNHTHLQSPVLQSPSSMFGQRLSGLSFGNASLSNPNFGMPNFGTPTYRPNVAHRSGLPTIRNQTVFDQGELFDHENKKKEFPPFSEIIAQGRFFGSLELAFLRPHFLGNTGISLDGPTFSESIPFEFDNETAPHARFGFESKYGPGFELNYFTLNANSNAISQAFDGVSSVTTIASVTGPNRFTQLSADAIGETLNANHSFEIETFGFNVFKDIEFKVSRIGGRFGLTYANIAQSLEASVTDGGGNILDSLDNTTDFRGFGPQLGIDYYRPVGHTPLEFVTSFSGLGLFGRRDQFVNNTAGIVERRFGADEFIAMLDLTSGIQYKKTVAENRAWFARLAFVHQTWLGGGTAVDPTGDFGMKGVTFAVGYNR